MDLETYIFGKLVENFCNNFLSELKDLRSVLEKLGVHNIKNSLPTPFEEKGKIKIQSYFSVDKRQLFLMFNKSEENSFSFLPVIGNPIPFGIFNFSTEESSIGASIFQNLTFQYGKGSVNIDYAFVVTQKGFIHRFENLREFTIDFLNAHRDSYIYNEKHKNDSYLNHLEHLKQQMSELFFDEKVPELTIDKFLEKNQIILKRSLHLENLNHQIVLKNLLNKYEHDLKPDLIAFDTHNKKWVIVDYKKAKRSIIKNLNKVRTGFISDVNNLENQLLDYLEYFEEMEQREYVNKTYKIDIVFPDAIGIIGNVSIEEQTAFTRLMKNKPRWYNVVPYNYLYDNFCRYIDSVKEIQKNRG